MSDLGGAIVERIRAVVGHADVPLHAPRFGVREQELVGDCIDSTFVSSVGPYVDRFERELAEFTGARRAVAVVNGTAALQVVSSPSLPSAS